MTDTIQKFAAACMAVTIMTITIVPVVTVPTAQAAETSTQISVPYLA